MKPIRDPKYLTLIRSLPCAVCGSHRMIEAAHVGPHGLGQKASDRSTIPLCRRHHRDWPDSLHALGPVRFMDRYRIKVHEIADRLAAKPTIRIEGANWIATVDGARYDLGGLGSPHAILSATERAWRTHAVEVLLAPMDREAVA